LQTFVAFLDAEFQIRPPAAFITVYLTPNPGELHALADKLHGLDVSRGTLGYAFQNDASVLAVLESTGVGTLLHELGHTIYQDGIDRTELPYDLRDDPQGFLNEGFAMFCEQPATSPAWLTGMVGLREAQARQLAPQLATQETASLLAFVRWCLTIVHFERNFYADPDQDLNQLWWDLEERYQLIPRQAGRVAPDWATKVHVATAPVYYQKYLLGRLFAAQLTRKMDADLGGWWQGRPKSGNFIKRELFMPGARYAWPELVERVTGQPLGVEALAAAVAWPRAV